MHPLFLPTAGRKKVRWQRQIQKQLFLDAIPTEFNRKGYIEITTQMGLNSKTAEKYLTEFRKAG
jgi:hypothetical protein